MLYITLHYVRLHYITLHTYITYMDAGIHTYIHYMHACIHTYIHPSMHACIHTYRQTARQAGRQTDRHTNTHRYIHAYIHALIHSYTIKYHPLQCTSMPAPERTRHPDSSTLKQHPAAAACPLQSAHITLTAACSLQRHQHARSKAHTPA